MPHYGAQEPRALSRPPTTRASATSTAAPAATLDAAEAYCDIAERAGLSPSALAILWCRTRQFVEHGSVIVGGTSIAQLAENLDAFDLDPSRLTDELRREMPPSRGLTGYFMYTPSRRRETWPCWLLNFLGNERHLRAAGIDLGPRGGRHTSSQRRGTEAADARI